MSARILVEANFDLFSIGVLIGGHDHLVVMESLDKGGDDFCFRDVGNIIPHLRKSSDVATEKLGRFLINTIQIVLGAQPSTRSHVIVGEDRSQDLM